MRITVLAVGRQRPPYVDDAQHYLKLLGRYARVEVVELRDEDRLGRRRNLRRTVFRLAVVRDDDVLKDAQGFGGKTLAGIPAGDRRLELQPDHAAHDVTDQVAIIGVTEPAFPRQFGCLRQVVQEQPHQHDVTIEMRVQRQRDVRDLEQLQRVFKQTADPCVMQRHRGGRETEVRHQVFIIDVRIGKRSHRGMLE